MLPNREGMNLLQNILFQLPNRKFAVAVAARQHTHAWQERHSLDIATRM